jgi:hypothetical protein
MADLELLGCLEKTGDGVMADARLLNDYEEMFSSEHRARILAENASYFGMH